jgi:hypothetical protein
VEWREFEKINYLVRVEVGTKDRTFEKEITADKTSNICFYVPDKSPYVSSHHEGFISPSISTPE